MKSAILHTSLKQFLKNGIREMSIQKLVEPLGISTKTVYKYFKNKQERLKGVLHLFQVQQFKSLISLPRHQSAVCLVFDIYPKALEVEYKGNKPFLMMENLSSTSAPGKLLNS